MERTHSGLWVTKQTAQQIERERELEIGFQAEFGRMMQNVEFRRWIVMLMQGRNLTGFIRAFEMFRMDVILFHEEITRENAEVAVREIEEFLTTVDILILQHHIQPHQIAGWITQIIPSHSDTGKKQ